MSTALPLEGDRGAAGAKAEKTLLRTPNEPEEVAGASTVPH
jgi:hypothetical protein